MCNTGVVKTASGFAEGMPLIETFDYSGDSKNYYTKAWTGSSNTIPTFPTTVTSLGKIIFKEYALKLALPRSALGLYTKFIITISTSCTIKLALNGSNGVFTTCTTTRHKFYTTVYSESSPASSSANLYFPSLFPQTAEQTNTELYTVKIIGCECRATVCKARS